MAVAMDDSQKISQLREKFIKKYVDPPTPKLEKFDKRDIMRIKNDDIYALSFIHWKKEVIDDAVEMVANVMEWRKENSVTDLSVESIGMEHFKQGAVYIFGRDMAGNRVMCLIGRLQNKQNKEQMRKVFTFWLERLQRSEPGKHITFILDTNKTAMSNVDMGMIRYIIDSFTTYFPDLLDKIIILDMPWIMNAIWNIVKQWMSEEQRSKTVFCSRKDLKKYISPDELPISMAGTVDWTYSFPPFPDNIGQDQEFGNDPMNSKKMENKVTEEKPGTSGAKKEEVTQQSNGDVPHRSPDDGDAPPRTPDDGEVPHRTPDDGDCNNNNHQTDDETKLTTNTRKIMTDKIQNKSDQDVVTDDLPSTSGRGDPTELKISKILDLPIKSTSSTSLKSVEAKSTTKEQVLPDTSVTDKQEKVQSKMKYTGDQMQRPDRLPNNVSFKSIVGQPGLESTMPCSETTEKIKVDTDEIMLGDLLIMSPVSELTFTVEGERLESCMNIRNQNTDTSENKEDNVYIAYKVKTTSPERYHVKPSVGVVTPGQSVRIRVYLNTGYEEMMSNDRFLLLYKQIPATEDKSLTHGEIVKFWKKNSHKALHFEHRLRVRLEGSTSSNIPISRNQEEVQAQTPSGSPSLVTSFLSKEEKMTPPGVESTQLHQQISLLSHKISRLENDSRWMRRRMRHSVGLLFIIILLLFFILYEVTMVSYSPSQLARTDL